jgi:hypothetical protein
MGATPGDKGKKYVRMVAAVGNGRYEPKTYYGAFRASWSEGPTLLLLEGFCLPAFRAKIYFISF